MIRAIRSAMTSLLVLMLVWMLVVATIVHQPVMIATRNCVMAIVHGTTLLQHVKPAILHVCTTNIALLEENVLGKSVTIKLKNRIATMTDMEDTDQ